VKKVDEEQLQRRVDILWNWAHKHDDHFHESKPLVVDDLPVEAEPAVMNVTGLCKCKQVMLCGGDEDKYGVRHTWEECFALTESKPQREKCSCGNWVFAKPDDIAGFERDGKGRTVTHRKGEPCFVSSYTYIEQPAANGEAVVDFNPMSPSTKILTFDVLRKEDATGTSGTGVVAIGAMFPDGTVVVQWQTHVRSVVTYGSMADALFIHGHGDSTGFRFHECPDRLYLSSGVHVSLTESAGE
jgi:hypothetical protein